VEVLDTPKRSKSVKTQSGHPLRAASDKAGWEAAFNPSQDLLISTNGNNGKHSHESPESPVAVDYEAYVQDEKYKDALKQREKPSKNAAHDKNKIAANLGQTKANDLWKLSEPIGGRMINANPVFSTDEKYAGRSQYIWNAANSVFADFSLLPIDQILMSTRPRIPFSLGPSSRFSRMTLLDRLGLWHIACLQPTRIFYG